MDTETDGASRAERRARAEELLARYPGLAPDELAHLHRWFSHEASALDVGLIASNEAVAERYRLYRRDHIDLLRPIDLVHALWFAALILGITVFIGWWGT
ncbi:hypothetical protein [Altererythrobacter lauratis]|uniref:Uncharacterized protein n=1 Tax=Alteraurantiacibacter lauratis TaxID=2054627 RepID=A0ABV7EGA8_9SPHN